jgi:hypothetical protein
MSRNFPMTDLRAGKVVSDGFLSEFVRVVTPFSAVQVTRSDTLYCTALNKPAVLKRKLSLCQIIFKTSIDIPSILLSRKPLKFFTRQNWIFYMRRKAMLFQFYFLPCWVVAFRFLGARHCKYKQSFLYWKICLYYKNNSTFTGFSSHELKIRILDFLRPGVDLLTYLLTYSLHETESFLRS